MLVGIVGLHNAFRSHSIPAIVLFLVVWNICTVSDLTAYKWQIIKGIHCALTVNSGNIGEVM